MKKPTRTRRSILALPKNEVRRLNFGEKVKRGLSIKGAYYVPKGTKVDKRTAYVTVSAWRDFQLGVPHGKAAKLRKEGRLGYGAKGEERGIPKSVLTRRSHKSQRANEVYDRAPTHCRQAANPRRKHIVCPACGHWQPYDDHHVDGRAVSDTTKPLCVNCHRKLHSYLRMIRRCTHQPS